ncbi:MAG: S1/P1 nuclease [Paludibacter sp.]|nr:S1/P1 nuclease [Paludibacter sp.]
MKHFKHYITLVFLWLSITLQAYDATGHRTIAEIAYKNLSCNTRHQVDKVLGKHGIIYASTWADEVRSDKEYSYSYPWHFQNLKDSMSADAIDFLLKNPKTEGEHLFYAIDLMITRLKKDKKDAEALKFLVHFVGDLHQPMHLGRFEDLGGNKIKTMWFGKEINIHSLWDTYMIESRRYTYSEYSKYLCDKFGKQKHQFAKNSISESVNATYNVRNMIYAYDMNNKNNYHYVYRFSDSLDEMLYRGGMQLAKILNEVY